MKNISLNEQTKKRKKTACLSRQICFLLNQEEDHLSSRQLLTKIVKYVNQLA